MAKFTFGMEKKDAVLAVKRALSGKVAILKDKNDCLKVGSPMMTVDISFSQGEVSTSASMIGKVLLGTVDSAIELIDGFTKL